MISFPESACIVGAGIGGLTTALLLAQRGVRVTVLEKRTALTEAGAGIQLSSNASRILIDLGLGPAVSRRAVEPERMIVRSLSNGSKLTSKPLGRFFRERYGAPYWVILRGDLHDVLLTAARSQPGIQLLVGRHVTDATDAQDHAELSLLTAGGTRQTLTTPLLVGADGMWSKLRSAWTQVPPPRFSGYEAWRCVIPFDSLPENLQEKQVMLWLGRQAHIVHYPVAGGKTMNVIIILRSDTANEGWGMPGNPEALERLTQEAPAPLNELLQFGGNWRVWSLFDSSVDHKWTGRHIAMLGDAAHPVLPFLAQGGALAIEDAAVLANKLQEGPDIPSALAAYEVARKERATRVQLAARKNGRIFHLPFPLSLGRNAVMRWMGEEGLTARYDWLYSWKPD